MNAVVNASALPSPAVVEVLDYEAIVSAIKADLLARYPEAADVLDLESEPLVKLNMVTLKKNSHLTILGMKKGENEYSYPPYSEVQAKELLDTLTDIAPFVVVDCGSYIANDILSAVAIMEADSVLRLAGADLKSVSYLSSQLPLLRDSKWDADKQYKVASNVKPQQAGEQVGQALGSVAFTLTHSPELEEQYLAGNLLADLSLKDSRPFRKEIEKIAKEVFGI